MSKLIYQDKTFLQELAEIPEINKVTDNNMNSIKKAVNENGQYVSATESNGEFTCTLEGSISQNDIVHILFDTNSTATPASLSVDGGNTFLNILDASGNSINASELSGQSVSLKDAGSHFEIETLNSYSSSKAMSYSANYVNNLISYSSDEVQCGTWFGKKKYRKSYYISALANTGTTYTPLNITNLSDIVDVHGTASNYNTFFPLPAYRGTQDVAGIQLYADSTNGITITTGNDRTSYHANITIEYTKTTD